MNAKPFALRNMLVLLRKWMTEMSDAGRRMTAGNGQLIHPGSADWHDAQKYFQGILEERLLQQSLVEHRSIKDASYDHMDASLQQMCDEWCGQIKKETAFYNRNNILRTTAYRKVYEESPELHWALLAHLVSRNGGYNMTDLRGQVGNMTLANQEQDTLFGFLEQCNYLIFQDAYPQLRLYQLGKRYGSAWLPLLRSFHASIFMQAAWDMFMEFGHSPMLTIAQIINEQSYIEKRVIQDPDMQQQVFSAPLFSMQELFHLTSVVFPALDHDGEINTYFGMFMDDFLSLKQRIRAGKVLYNILFQGSAYEPKLELLQFAQKVKHTGSRADYVPVLFSKRSDDRARFFSPELQTVWPNQSHPSIVATDWCTKVDVMRELSMMHILPQKAGDITSAYLRKLEEIRTLAQFLPFS